MKPFFCLVAIVLDVSLVFPQGTWESVGPYGGWINDLTEDNTGRILAATTFGGIYRTADDGELWVQIYNDALIFDPRSVATNSSGHIFVGSEGIAGVGFLRSTDDGLSWDVLPNSLAFSGVADLFVADNGDIFACTFGDGVYHSTDNGTTFDYVSGLPAIYPTSVKENSTGDLFVGTQYDGTYFYRSTDNGTTWEIANNGITSDVTEVFVTPSDEIFAATGLGVYESTNSGDSWTNLMAPGGGYTSVTVTSNGDIYTSTQAAVYRSTNGGTTWTEESGLPDAFAQDLLSSSGGMIFAGTLGPGVFRSSGTADWEQTITGMSATIIDAMTDGPNGELYASSRWVGVAYSSDAGLTWENRSNGLPWDWYPSMGVNEETGTLFLSNTFSRGYRSTNLGITWEELTIPACSDWESGTQGDMFGGSAFSNILYHSTDDGVTWNNILLPVSPISGIEINDAGHIFVSSGDQFGGGDGICLSTDNGASFNLINNGLNNLAILDLRDLSGGIPSSSCDLNIACLGGDDVISLFDETNSTWVPAPSGRPQAANVLFDIDDGGEHTLGAVTPQVLYNLFEPGCSWGVAPLLNPVDILTAEQLEEGGAQTGAPIVLVGTFGGGILRGPFIPTGVEQTDDPLPRDFALEQNYPNPFNPQTEIQFVIRHSSVVNLSIHDLLGREIATLVNEKKAPGTYKVSWDASGFASGVYFYRLSTTGFTQTKKLVLLR